MHQREFININHPESIETVVNSMPYARVKINNQNVIALLDTAAENSVIDEEFIKQNKGMEDKILRINNVNVLALNRRKVAHTKFMCYEEVEIANVAHTVKFIVIPNMLVQIIIGAPDLNALKIIINMQDRKIFCDGERVEWINKEEEEKERNVRNIERNYTTKICDEIIEEVNENREIENDYSTEKCDEVICEAIDENNDINMEINYSKESYEEIEEEKAETYKEIIENLELVPEIKEKMRRLLYEHT